MKKRVALYWYIWVYPIILFLSALYGFHDSGGTDFDRQVGVLESCKNDSISFMFADLFSDDVKNLYHIIYNVIYNLFGISPRLYIALITLTYFCLIIFIMRNYHEKNFKNLSNKDLSFLCAITTMSFCPLLFSTSRNFCAVTFLYAGLFFWMNKKHILACVFFLLPIFVHEGIKIMYAIILLGCALYYFWIRNCNSLYLRNIVVVVICIILLVLGGSFFTSVASYWFEQGLLSEHYMETYGTQVAGDGIYKTVLVLTMLGPLTCLFINCIMDKRNNLVYGITVAGLFAICLLYNQKIFYVQRIMMFMPIFIGLTSYQICSDYFKANRKTYQIYKYIMWLVPANVLFQFLIQFNLYFGNLL